MSFFSKVARGFDWFTGSFTTIYVINCLIKEYGTMVELKIDNKKKCIIASILLKGEDSPIGIRVGKYEIIKNGSSRSVIVKDAGSDKAWLNAVLKNFVIGQAFDVPTKGIDFLNDFLG
jgi:hypothetical protein